MANYEFELIMWIDGEIDIILKYLEVNPADSIDQIS